MRFKTVILLILSSLAISGVLVVPIDEYQNTLLSDLPTAWDLSRTFETFFEKFTSIKVIENPSIRELLDEVEKTKGSMLSIFFGHTVYKHGQLYLLLSDSDPFDSNTWLSLSSLGGSVFAESIWMIITPEIFEPKGITLSNYEALAVGELDMEISEKLESIEDEDGDGWLSVKELSEVLDLKISGNENLRLFEFKETTEETAKSYIKLIPEGEEVIGAEVELDGKAVGTLSRDVMILEVKPGRHVVRIEAEKIEPIVLNVEVGENEDREYTVRAELRKIKVKIDSEPRGAKIYIDGKFVGYTPKYLEMRFGDEKEIELRKEGYKRLRGKIKITKVESVIKLYKLEKSPTITWQKALGGSAYDRAYSVIETSDGGYLVVGYTGSNDGDVSGNHGGADMWVVKLDMNGNLIWQKTLGGSGWDWARSVIETSDGGYLVVGYTESNDGDVSGNYGGADMWVVKLDESGDITWQKTLGGSGDDWVFSVVETSDGGCLVVGYTESNDGDVSGNHGGSDMWVVKLK